MRQLSEKMAVTKGFCSFLGEFRQTIGRVSCRGQKEACSASWLVRKRFFWAGYKANKKGEKKRVY